ncbi:Hypothetical predicted protein [Octopus vulgaris]|uniref:Uncharacterized protein n=1 Tax=Octopus vulgaris TaxID=6645 RepID=A0AA36BTQ3_OCTVU|nr:Hypothetical predicted protein [Octopus vulgaris]
MCGLSNSPDGTEDNLLWEDEREAEVEATSSDCEFEPYDDSLVNVSHNVLQGLLLSADDDDDDDDVPFEVYHTLAVHFSDCDSARLDFYTKPQYHSHALS